MDTNTDTNTATANGVMTDGKKRKLNGLLKVYLADNTQKGALEKSVKKTGGEIKDMLTDAGLMVYTGGGAVASMYESARPSVDTEAAAGWILALLKKVGVEGDAVALIVGDDAAKALADGKLPSECYKTSVSLSLRVKAA